MIPRDKNIIQVLNLLSLLFRAREQKIPKLSDEEQYTLTITSEHLEGTHLTVPVLLNTLEVLNKRGYLVALGIFESEYHQKIREAFEDVNYTDVLKQLSDNNVDKLSIEHKQAYINEIEKMAPASLKLDKEQFVNEEITFRELLDHARSVLADHKDTDIAVVILMPFRDIDGLLNKMNSGMTFDEIQDSSIWYDSEKYEFHIGTEVIPTNYQGKPNIEHAVLDKFHECVEDGVIGFDDTFGFKPKALQDSLNRFLDKNDKLKQLFTVHRDRLTINRNYLD